MITQGGITLSSAIHNVLSQGRLKQYHPVRVCLFEQLRCNCPCTFFPISSAFRKGIFPILWYKEFHPFHRVINHEDGKCHNLVVLSYGVTWSVIQQRSIFPARRAMLHLILQAFCIWMVLWLKTEKWGA